ncbi:putative thioesterase [Streptomyces albus]|uniref:Putative thioesterase n=1 Tax=Streptomyces albus (strain ATCC 21838 / DSM 41398 / FERM P-419 / JCM 4703 / NBRC 107858) TaxID=1081613 RepID=A0A0B5F1M2_STRA4|nr:putative thioesterase [Streptomyces albus]AOU79788.1 putative thioesterase [Streptomyces albus]AYN35513.1 putative thioesterase [Streptomyces albus]
MADEAPVVQEAHGAPRDVVAFPGAGAFGSEFRALRDALPPGARLLALQYPGRAAAPPGPTSFEALVAACAARIRALPGPPRVLLGHSFGAFLAYATAAALQATGTEVAALVVVGADAPDRVRLPVEAARSREATRAYLEGIGEDVLGQVPDEEWRAIAVDTAWWDLALLTAFPGPAGVRLRCPVLAVRGNEDPITADDRIAAWAATTTGGFASAALPGGHTDVLASPEFLARVGTVVTPPATGTTATAGTTATVGTADTAGTTATVGTADTAGTTATAGTADTTGTADTPRLPDEGAGSPAGGPAPR